MLNKKVDVSLYVYKLYFAEENDKVKKSSDDDDEDDDGEDDEDDDAEATAEDKWGKGGIDRPVMRTNKQYSLCPIHMAIEGGHLVCNFI